MPPGLSSAMTLKRIHREINDLKKEDMGGITLTPTDNLFVWKAGIPGPEGSVYEGGVFNAEIHLAPDYPFMAPKVVFSTRIYHMNISDRGNVCIDILKHNWSPALSIFKVVLSLSSLLTDPNPKDPLVPSIASEYTRNREQHNRTAREWTRLYACPPAPPPKPKAPSVTASRASTSTPGPSTSTATSRASSTTRAPGKAKAAPSRTATPLVDDGAGRSASAAIAIDDSDDEGSTMSRKRKRRPGPDSSALVLDEDDGAAGSGIAKRNKVESRQTGSGDVIVIDD
ncbi:hypothetical protein NEOLEDRAFT_1178346 [Neolentinus lepideus HHB14362 ss-1]|uniref:UBC core domain-containing protein n=1 Tax=Neolentinus lepideus HHB14362 ss-1 TaxID=1314782 RepID=A0A165SRM3_9AGAM|nr:hypothetical protein NEOLEDRAFT_1178346 [Neolentinus lepideus HHB14362 ss-1]